jgi:hypothetical protein
MELESKKQKEEEKIDILSVRRERFYRPWRLKSPDISIVDYFYRQTVP